MAIQLPVFSHAPIDIHSHFNHGSPCDTPQNLTHIRDLEFVKAGYDRFGIQYAGMSTFASVVHHPECVVEENHYLHNLVQKNNWMYQWVVIDPRQPETYRQAQQMLGNHGFLIQNPLYCLQACGISRLHRKHNTLASAIAPAKGNHHPNAGLDSKSFRNTVRIGLVDGKGSRRNSNFGNHTAPS
jgi:hypothetical protein